MYTQGAVKYLDILKGLQQLGVTDGDTLLVHSSLSSFGRVEGGPDTVIEALLDAVGSKGNLVMPTLSFSGVNEAAPFFDVNDTPSDCGMITETFRRKPGVTRSGHPLSSAAVSGEDASYLASDHHPTPCGVGSPYYKVFELKGRSLFIGVDFKSNTLFHVAEELVAPTYMRYKLLKNVQVKTVSGKIVERDFCRYDCYQTGIIRKLEKMEGIFKEWNAVRELNVGQSHFMLIDAAENIRISSEILRNKPEFILSSADV